MEYNTRTLKQKQKRGATTVYLKNTDKKALIKECGDAACLLFEYYLSKSGIKDFEYTDAKSAYALGWTERKVRSVRGKLTKAKYYAQRTATYADKRKVITTYLGKEQVNQLPEKEAVDRSPKDNVETEEVTTYETK
jgi:hypothetical protein